VNPADLEDVPLEDVEEMVAAPPVDATSSIPLTGFAIGCLQTEQRSIISTKYVLRIREKVFSEM